MNPDPAECSEPRWGMGDAVAGWMAALVCSTLAVGAWIAVTGDAPLSFATLLVGQAGLWMGLLAAPLIASRRKGSGHVGADLGLSAERADVAGLVVGVACQLLLIPFLYLVIQWFTGPLDVAGPARELTDRADGIAFLILALLVVLVAPVVEELFYRGLLMRAAARRWGDPAAVVVSSAVFAASHFEIVIFPGIFAFGVVLAVLAVRTGRLGASIAAHIGFNAVTVLALAASR